MNFAFVVLHYQNSSVTEKCISLLQKLDGIDETYIILVDNASSNGSGKYLQDKYSEYANIVVLLNKKNDGFAKGNNLGYNYARDVLNANLIVVMNSDVFIDDLLFIRKTKEAFSKSNADIIAPDIYAMKGFYQNPLREKALTLQEVRKWYCKVCCLLVGVSIPYIGDAIARKLQNIHDENDRRKAMNNHKMREGKVGIVPHGSCVIFGNKWVQSVPFAFMPYTFMYCEEFLLAYYIESHGYRTEYVPEIKVVHEAGASRKVDYSKLSTQMRAFYKNERQSIKQLLYLMKGKIEL